MFVAMFLPVLSALAPASPEQLRSFDDYPATRIDYYYVEGTSARALRAQMRNLGPRNGGTQDATARAFYTFDIGYTQEGPKPCNAAVTLRTHIRFPRHKYPAAMSPRLRTEWTRYIRELEHHELGHVALAYAALPKLKAAIESGSCRTAAGRTRGIDAELRRKQEAFDANPANRVRDLRDPT